MTRNTCTSDWDQSAPDSIKLLIHRPAAPALFIKSADLMELYYPALMNLDCTNEGTLILILSSRFSPGHAILKYLMLQYLPGEDSSGSVMRQYYL